MNLGSTVDEVEQVGTGGRGRVPAASYGRSTLTEDDRDAAIAALKRAYVRNETLRPDRRPEAQDGQPVRPAAREEDHGPTFLDQRPDAPREPLGARGDLVELGVEVVQQPADRLGVGALGTTHGRRH